MTSRRWIAVALVAGAGIALRVWVYRSALGAPDSDEAIVGLMARHILHGELTTFYWGQVYGGSQEALLTAPGFAIFGSTLAALRAVPIALAALTSILLWRVGLRTLGPGRAVVAGLLFWIWPPFAIVHGTVAYGFYGTDVAYAALLLLLALRIDERPSPVRMVAFAVVLGLAFWQTAQIVPVALPTVLWIVRRRPVALRSLWYTLPAAAVGALPWLVWNARHHWASVLARSSASDYVHGLRLFFSPLLPMLLGLRAPLSAQLLLPKVLVYLVYVGLLAGFAVQLVRTRRGSVSLVHIVALAFPFVWAVSHRVTLLTSHPVYLIVLSPVLALLLAQLAVRPVAAAGLVVACAAVSAVTLQRMDVWLTSAGPHWPPTTPRSLAPLVATLDRLRLDRVYAEYWVAYRLDFDTRERIVATPDEWLHWRVRGDVVTPVPATGVRYPPYQREVARARHGYVFLTPPTDRAPIIGALLRHGYRRVRVGPFQVFAPPGG